MMPSSTKQKFKKYSAYFLSIAVIFLCWFIAAKLINSELILPEPWKVFIKIRQNIVSWSFWKSFLFTFVRILISFAVTIILGIILGTLCAEFKFVDDFLRLPITIIRSTPVVALILIMLFWFSSTFVPVVICLLMTLPIMISSVKTGILNTREETVFFAKTRNFNRFNILIFMKLPNARINMLEGAVQCFSLAWKVVIAGEVLCLPRNAIGARIHMSQIHLETADVLANTIILVVISFVLESVLKKLVKSFELKIQNN